MIEKLPTGGRPEDNPPSSSVPVQVGQTAAEGERQGKAGNDGFNRQLNAQFEAKRPPYFPQ